MGAAEISALGAAVAAVVTALTAAWSSLRRGQVEIKDRQDTVQQHQADCARETADKLDAIAARFEFLWDRLNVPLVDPRKPKRP